MKHLKTLFVASVVGLASLAPTANAARDFGAIYIECGLGALIAPNTAWVAVITNITWDFGTTAITSELSSPQSCKGGQAKTAMMIYEAFPSIETELAQGRGEHLDALLLLAGRAKADHAALIVTLRTEFAKTVAKAEYSDMLRYERAEALYELFQAVVVEASASAS